MLIAGGLLKPKNLDDVVERVVEELLKRVKGEDAVKYPPLALAVDTNVLYARIFTNWLLDQLEAKKLMPLVVVSKAVRNELMKKIDREYKESSSQLTELRKSCVDEMVKRDLLVPGVSTTEARRAFLALHEEHIISSKVRFAVAKAKGVGDQKIVDSYYKFKLKHLPWDVLFITCDDKIRGRAEMLNLMYSYIDQGKLEVLEFLPYRKVPDLMLSLATYMMQVTLSSDMTSVAIRGVWRGKRYDDWVNGVVGLCLSLSKEEHVKIYENSEKLTKIFKVVGATGF